MKIDDALKQVQEFLNQKKYDEIEEIASQLILENPESVELHMLLGKAAFENGRLEDAKYYFYKTTKIDDKNIDALLWLAKAKALRKENLEARNDYKAVLDAAPGNTSALIGIADIAFESDEYANAAEGYLDILKTGAKDKLDVEMLLSVVHKLAFSYVRQEKREEALEVINTYAPDTFNESIAIIKLEAIQITNPEAVDEIKECLELLHQHVPDEPEYILQLIAYLKVPEDTKKMEVLFDKLSGLEISDILKEEYLGRHIEFNVSLERWDKALESLNAMIEMNENSFFYEKRSKVKKELNDIAGAIEDLDHAIQLTEGADKTLLLTKGELLVLKGDSDQAFKEFETVAKTADRELLRGRAHYQMGLIYKSQQNPGEAFKMLTKAEALGSRKAREVLLSEFSEQLSARMGKARAFYMDKFADEFKQNESSPILSEVIGKLWVPDMQKILKELEDDMAKMPGKLIKAVLEGASKELFLITPQALLLLENNTPPLEAFYRIEVESQHAVLLELQPSKSGPTSNMQLSFLEGGLLITYPFVKGETNTAYKYFREADEATDEQKERLTSKDTSYVEVIEELISTVTN